MDTTVRTLAWTYLAALVLAAYVAPLWLVGVLLAVPLVGAWLRLEYVHYRDYIAPGAARRGGTVDLTGARPRPRDAAPTVIGSARTMRSPSATTGTQQPSARGYDTTDRAENVTHRASANRGLRSAP